MDNKNTMIKRKKIRESQAMQISAFYRIPRDLQMFTLTMKVAYLFFTIEFKRAVFTVYQGKKKSAYIIIITYHLIQTALRKRRGNELQVLQCVKQNKRHRMSITCTWWCPSSLLEVFSISGKISKPCNDCKLHGFPILMS